MKQDIFRFRARTAHARWSTVEGACRHRMEDGTLCGEPFRGPRNRKYCIGHSAAIHHSGLSADDQAAQERRQRVEEALEASYVLARRKAGKPPPMSLARAREIALEVAADTEAGIRRDREEEAQRIQRKAEEGT